MSKDDEGKRSSLADVAAKAAFGSIAAKIFGLIIMLLIGFGIYLYSEISGNDVEMSRSEGRRIVAIICFSLVAVLMFVDRFILRGKPSEEKKSEKRSS